MYVDKNETFDRNTTDLAIRSRHANYQFKAHGKIFGK